jgi:hypothetical protein
MGLGGPVASMIGGEIGRLPGTTAAGVLGVQAPSGQTLRTLGLAAVYSAGAGRRQEAGGGTAGGSGQAAAGELSGAPAASPLPPAGSDEPDFDDASPAFVTGYRSVQRGDDYQAGAGRARRSGAPGGRGAGHAATRRRSAWRQPGAGSRQPRISATLLIPALRARRLNRGGDFMIRRHLLIPVVCIVCTIILNLLWPAATNLVWAQRAWPPPSCAGDEHEPNDDWREPSLTKNQTCTLAEGVPLAAQIGEKDSVDWFRFHVQAGHVYRLALWPSPALDLAPCSRPWRAASAEPGRAAGRSDAPRAPKATACLACNFRRARQDVQRRRLYRAILPDVTPPPYARRPRRRQP